MGYGGESPLKFTGPSPILPRSRVSPRNLEGVVCHGMLSRVGPDQTAGFTQYVEDVVNFRAGIFVCPV